MSDRLRDLPRVKELAGMRRLVGVVLAGAAVVRPIIRLAGRDVAAFDKKVAEWRQWEQLAIDLETVPDRFNDLFCSRALIIDEMGNFDLAKACVAKAEGDDIDGAERDLIEAVTPDLIRWKLMLMRGVRAFNPRMALAERARVDFSEGRYYASTLVTLSLLDGLVNDLHPRQIGFFATDVDLAAWDSLSAHSTGLGRLSRLLQEPRTKTTTEQITIPYRHGILHGRDLGYNNKVVAAKAWLTLFAVRDWAMKAEQKRLGPPAPKPKTKLLDTLRGHAEWRKENDAIQILLGAWRPRTIEVGRDCPATGEPADMPDGTPERTALEFFACIRRGNYGGLVRTLDPSFVGGETVNRLAGQFRTRFASTRIDDLRLLNISDEAPGFSVISINVRGRYHDEPFEQQLNMRLAYKSDERNLLPRGAKGGRWCLVFLPDLPTDPSLNDEDE